MNILLVTLKYLYGDPKKGIDAISEYGFHQGLLALGHNVEAFYYDEFVKDSRPLQNKLIQHVTNGQYDLVFFCLYTHQFETRTLAKIKELTKTIAWFGDDTWRFEEFTSLYAPFFTYCVTTDFLSIPKYENLGVRPILGQWATYDISDRQSADGDYLYDVSFVGWAHPYRKWFVSQLQKKGINVQAFGMGWPNGPISSEKMFEVFSRSKINLNIGNSSSYDIRYLLSGLGPIFRFFFRSKFFSQIKARNFEIPYHKGFQLTDYVPGLERYFRIGEEVACYSGSDEAATVIRYYLDHPEEREEILKRGSSRAQKEHTYTHRFQEIFAQLDFKSSQKSLRSSSEVTLPSSK